LKEREIMKKHLMLSVLLLWPGLGYCADSNGKWSLEKSEIDYTVTHPLHVVHGKSLSAKGEGIRYSDGIWKFLVAVPVRSFTSGDNNRDLHMQEVTKAGINPLIKVNVEIDKVADQKAPQTLIADAQIEFAGQKADYPKVILTVLEWKGGEAHITGTIPLTLKDFAIQPPALLTVPIKNEVPIVLDMWWNQGPPKKSEATKS
jgi:hypothetical protein